MLSLVRAAILRGETPDNPKNPKRYTLGTGHIRFFYPRLDYLAKRQAELIKEMQNRGYSPQFTSPEALIVDIPQEWCNDWTPSAEALAINRSRIAERILKQNE